MPGPTETQARTLDQFIEGWKAWTPEAWTASWSPDCQQKMLPFTLGVPARSLDEVMHVLPKMMEVLTNYEVDFYHVIHDPARNKAAIYATSQADTPFEDYKWTNEYAVFLTFSENGAKVERIEEMVDTAFFKEFFPRFQKYLKDQSSAS